jgi:hypothetical protein
LESSARHLARAIRRWGRPRSFVATSRKPIFLLDIVASDGSELTSRLLEQGVFGDEVILKYCWPRYAPPVGAGIRSIAKYENLVMQFERLIAMHRESPSSFPMPLATVRSPEGEFAGYIIEYVPGDTLQTIISQNMLKEARRQLGLVESVIAKLHEKAMPHGDINASNIIAADDGRTLLIDPVANTSPGMLLQDTICLGQLRQQIEDASLLHETTG